MMPKNITMRNSIQFITLIAAAGAAGWFGFESTLFDGPRIESQRFIASVFILIWLWRFIPNRLCAWLSLASWHVGAASCVPQEWRLFFGNEWGWPVLITWGLIISAPLLVLPHRWRAAGLCFGSLVAAITPFGMANPLLAATAFFPGWQWIGLFLAALLLALPVFRSEKVAISALIGACVVGTSLHMLVPPMTPPTDAWAVQTNLGKHPSLPSAWFKRQIDVANRVNADIEAGARLIVTPEGTVDVWDGWATPLWRKTAQMAKDRNAVVLLGIYRQAPGGRWENGLLSLGDGAFYPSVMPMPIGMWHPWQKTEHYPMALGALGRVIHTPHGDAAYLLCYEELLLWPLAAKMAVGTPHLLIAAANQWFTDEKTSIAQSRSVRLQASLWGLPLLRSVNYSQYRFLPGGA